MIISPIRTIYPVAVLALVLALTACGQERHNAIRLEVAGTNALLAGDTDAALELLHQAVQADPSYGDAVVNLASAQRQAGRNAPPALAADFFAKAESNCFLALTTGLSPKKNISTLEKLVDAEPGQDEKVRLLLVLVLYDQANLSLGQGDWSRAQAGYQRARDQFNEAVRRMPDFAQTYRRTRAELAIGLGLSYSRLESTEDPEKMNEHQLTARRYFHESVEADPLFPMAHYLYASACLIGTPALPDQAEQHKNRYRVLSGLTEEKKEKSLD